MEKSILMGEISPLLWNFDMNALSKAASTATNSVRLFNVLSQHDEVKMKKIEIAYLKGCLCK